MEPSSITRARPPCSHHHHHYCHHHQHHHHFCHHHHLFHHHHHHYHHHLHPIHNHTFQHFNGDSSLRHAFFPLPLQNPESISPYMHQNHIDNSHAKVHGADFSASASATQILEAPEQEELGEHEEEDDDEDPIFVLTDEWREFFVKSEAKRKLEKKQQAKRKEKK